MNDCLKIIDHIGYSEIFNTCYDTVSYLVWNQYDWFKLFYGTFLFIVLFTIILYLMLHKIYELRNNR
jgi:hypothetical protein